MSFLKGEGFSEGFTVMGLAVWASLTLILMLIRSWTAGNYYWVLIFSGLICLSAAFSVYTWRVLVLDQKGGAENGEQQGVENYET